MVGGAAEGVGRRLERSGIEGDPIRRGVKRQRVGTTAIDSSLTERPRCWNHRHGAIPRARLRRTRSAACTVHAQPPWVRIGRGGEAASGLDLCGPALYPADNPPQPAQRVHFPKPGWRSGARSPCLP